MSFITGTACELLYASTTATAAMNTFTTEVCINPGSSLMGVQARIPPDFWLPNNTQTAKAIKIIARGILSTRSTGPSYTWNIRAGGNGSITGPILLGTAAILMNPSLVGQIWTLEGDVIVSTMGAAGANSTFQGFGVFNGSPVDAAAAIQTMNGAAATLDTSITNYINVTVTSSFSNLSNSITLQQLLVWGLN